jgi:hypothetical protein
MGAKAGSRAGSQTYDKLQVHGLQICLQAISQGLQSLQMYDFFASMWLAKIPYVCKTSKIIPCLLIGISPLHRGIGPLHRAQIGIHIIQFGQSLVIFAQLSAILLLKHKHYFISSFIFPSPGDVSVTAIAAPAAKRRTHPPACRRPQPHASLSSRSKMPLPPPSLGEKEILFFLRTVLNLDQQKLIFLVITIN